MPDERGFLERWSRRKTAAREAPDEPNAAPDRPALDGTLGPAPLPGPAAGAADRRPHPGALPPEQPVRAAPHPARPAGVPERGAALEGAPALTADPAVAETANTRSEPVTDRPSGTGEAGARHSPLDLEEVPPDLPPLDSLGAGSDFTPFLRPGVPKALRKAALRRAWTAKPAISGHRPLVEYDWDFNAPGYGKLRPGDSAEKLVGSLFKGLRRVLAEEADRALQQSNGQPEAQEPAAPELPTAEPAVIASHGGAEATRPPSGEVASNPAPEEQTKAAHEGAPPDPDRPRPRRSEG